MAHLRQAILVLALLTCSCSKTSTADLPPPLAGLWLPAAVRPGQAVVLDASSTAVATAPADDPGASGTRVTLFRFEIATFAAVERQVPNLSWTFPDPGHYALRLVVTDDLGRQSSVDSAIDVVSDLADACTGTVADACASGACASGQCAAFACAGDPACPSLNGHALVCDQGACVITPAIGSPDDAYGGDDVGAIGAADAPSP